MTSLYDTVDVTKEKYLTNSYKYKNTFLSKKRKKGLKSKENTYNIRCNKELKRKLKKYKLRHDGKEDQDVLDVSDFLITSLIIKSPNSKEQLQSKIEDIKYTRPKNYLFKMGRQSSKSNGTKSDNNSKEKTLNENNIDWENRTSQSDNQLQKQTNAFQLLMDSRNRVIGSNSPGKEKSIDVEEEFKVIEKKELKMKRVILLQKMAEAKGSLKKIEMEEYQQKCIKKKMEKRSEKFRSMILNKETKTKENTNMSDKVEYGKNTQINKTAKAKETNGMKLSTLQLVNMFNECEMQVKISPKKKQIPKEDEEFLKKLSPSLKKKENMLSYFKKVEKDIETVPEKSECDSLVIKVKLKTKNKTNTKRKLSLKKMTDTSNDLLLTSNNNINKVDSEELNLKFSNDDEHKESLTTLVTQPIITNGTLMVNEERPKRSIKRPVKYIEDSNFSSSDEDCHIFTPKKKKNTIMQLKSKVFDGSTADVPLSVEKSKNLTKDKIIHKESQKKPVKLAPIFTTKVPPSLADIEAKNKFLQSGVPDQLKKRNIKQEVSSSVSTWFPITVHIQQNTKNNIEMPYNLSLVDINIENYISQPSDELYTSLIHISNTQSTEKFLALPTQDVNTMLKNIKQLYKRFPVYRTYRLLKDKNKGELKDHSYLELDNSVEIMNSFVDIWNENPDQLNWASKYKPTSSKQIIGNFESIKELKKWLVQWKENEAKNKTGSKNDSDFSDFYHSDTDSRESMKATNNLLIITGPVGCGKTSGVYAVAAELAFKVLEVNASGKRTGKIMLQDLHEATQSHKVNRGTTSGAENSQKSQDIVNQSSVSKPKKRGRPKKCNGKMSQKYSGIKTDTSNGTQSSQESTRTAMSLILIDDADIVFEQDDGFSSAVVQLVQCSKRPVILISSTQSCVHLQRFFQIGKIIKMKPLLPRMLGTWLDLLCLANNGICWPGIGAKFLEYFKGDMRKTINYLQFYTQTENSNNDGITTSLDVDMNIQHLDDEKSNTSWIDQVDTENSDPLNLDINQVWTLFTGEMFDLVKSRHTIPLLNIWWNIPKFLNVSADKSAVLDKGKCSEFGRKSSKDKLRDLNSLANAIDSISFSDLFGIKKADNACVTNLPWFTAETHSVSEHDNVENYTRAYELSEEISQEYAKNNILHALKYRSSGNLNSMPLDFPGIKIKREKDCIVSRHNSLNNCLNPSAALDRRALALDYWSTCRTICRIERTKTDNNSKRNNRFCHYLKSMNVNCKSDSFENLAESLYVKERDC